MTKFHFLCRGAPSRAKVWSCRKTEEGTVTKDVNRTGSGTEAIPQKRGNISALPLFPHCFSRLWSWEGAAGGAARLNFCCVEQFRAGADSGAGQGREVSAGRESSLNAHPIDPGGRKAGNLRYLCRRCSDGAQGNGVLKDFSQEGPKRVGSP